VNEVNHEQDQETGSRRRRYRRDRVFTALGMTVEGKTPIEAPAGIIVALAGELF